MRLKNPYHDGERGIQQRTGETQHAERNSRVVEDAILEGALVFIERQNLLVLGSQDRDGRLWASVLFGERGFLAAPDEQQVQINLEKSFLALQDPLLDNLSHKERFGGLVIDLETRMRIRLNGRAQKIENRLQLTIEESFPNCPKYIQRRTLGFGSPCETAPESSRGQVLKDPQRKSIAQSDTLFVSSMHSERGLDVSHRGGMPGFVEIVKEDLLRIPDYKGNGMFMTLGNLAVDSRAGLVFLDFARGNMLQLTGRASTEFDQEDPDGKTGGTNRFWTFSIEEWVESSLPVKLAVEFLDYSPFNPR